MLPYINVKVLFFLNSLNKLKFSHLVLPELLIIWLINCFDNFFFLSLKGCTLPGGTGYQVNVWSRWRKFSFRLPTPKNYLMCCPQIEDISDIKLLRTDPILGLSQKAENWCFDKIFAKNPLWLYMFSGFGESRNMQNDLCKSYLSCRSGPTKEMCYELVKC